MGRLKTANAPTGINAKDVQGLMLLANVLFSMLFVVAQACWGREGWVGAGVGSKTGSFADNRYSRV